MSAVGAKDYGSFWRCLARTASAKAEIQEIFRTFIDYQQPAKVALIGTGPSPRLELPMRFSMFIGIILVLLSGCTAGKNQIALIDCGAYHARQGTSDPDTKGLCW